MKFLWLFSAFIIMTNFNVFSAFTKPKHYANFDKTMTAITQLSDTQYDILVAEARTLTEIQHTQICLSLKKRPTRCIQSPTCATCKAYTWYEYKKQNEDEITIN